MGRSRTRILSLLGLLFTLFFCLGFGRTGLPGGSVPIGDRKAFHGAHCQPLDGNFDDFTYDDMGIYQISMYYKFVMCPLLRDVTGGSDDLNHIAVELSVQSGYTQCTALTMTEDGNSNGLVLDYATDDASGNGAKQLDFYFADTSPGNEGTYWVECLLGHNDILRHIYVNEGD